MNQDSKDEHVKTVYAHFGLALYLAQVLEHGLANALMSAELLPRRAGKPFPRKQWEAELDLFMNEQFDKPLGRLVNGLRKVTSVPTDLETLLTTALKTRNFLAHHFFRERAELFMSRGGREKMIEELESAQRLFEAADEKLTEVAKPFREKYGLTDEKLKPFEQKYLNTFENDL
jgi:hypothetical protein